MRTYTESITKTVLNEQTGKLETERYLRDTQYHKENIRQGWMMVYLDYDEMLAKVVKSNLDMKLVMHLKQKINSNFELHINITKEANRIGVGRDKLSKTLSKLVEANFLRRTEVGFKSNPFMFLPFRPSNAIQAQKEWREIYDEKDCNV